MGRSTGVGYCKLVMEDATGKVLRDDDDFYVISRSGTPAAGDWLRLRDVGRFFVDRVEFEEEEKVRTRKYINLILFIRPEGAPRSPAPGGGGGRSAHRPLFPSNH